MEAEILHQIDNLDASMQMMLTSIRLTEPGQYTDRIFGMDNRSFMYRKKCSGDLVARSTKVNDGKNKTTLGLLSVAF